MASKTQTFKSLVSSKIYAQIITSPIGPRILPGRLETSPYEVLDYDAALLLRDPGGRTATFQRTQRIRFLQAGASAILDHFWGDGLLLADYFHSAGAIGDSFKDEGRRHIVIELRRPMRRGDVLAFKVRRTVLLGFTKELERLETTIDHPVERIALRIQFPRKRPCRIAVLQAEGTILPLYVSKAGAGTLVVRAQILGPQAHTAYVIRWAW